MAKKTYTEPSDYFPKEIRREFKIGEYHETASGAAGKKKETPKPESKKNKK